MILQALYFEEGPSQVARVIFILDEKVIDDYDPLNYGPPGDPNPLPPYALV